MTLLQLLDKVDFGTATKAEEMEALRRVAGKCGESSYLHSLLSGELLVWVDKQIEDDIAPDLWAAMEAQRKGHVDAQVKACDLAKEKAIREAELVEDNKALARRLEIVGEKADRLEALVERLTEDAEDWSDSWDTANDIIKAVAEEAQEAWFEHRQVKPETLRAVIAQWFSKGE